MAERNMAHYQKIKASIISLMMVALWLGFSYLFVAQVGWAVQANRQLYHFANHRQDKRFHQLLSQLRCLVCQNENLANSRAPLAQDLRATIATKIRHGQTNQQIKHYLVQRYGDFVLYKPPIEYKTYLLWFGPFVLLAIGLLTLAIVIKRMRSHKEFS